VFDTLSHFTAWCGTPGAVQGSIAAGMLLAGAASSPLHCAPMCGGFVLGQVSDRMARLPAAGFSECARFRAASAAPYHLGRLTTYSVLGLAAGSGGLIVQQFGGGVGIFLLMAAALLVLQATRRLRPASKPGIALPLARSLRGYPLGLALGFLPCGLIYAALAAAAATGSPLFGGLAMLCFGLGTIPTLFAVGLLGAAAGHRFRRGLTTFTPAMLLINAGLLTFLGLRLLTRS
jgi:sulfite exporter TauE/SafE